MKGHKGHHHKHPRAEHAKGGQVESAKSGDWDKDESPSETYAGKGSNVEKEAKERKHGGKAKKHLGKMEGKKSEHRADRMPRKSGGRAGSNANPLSSAHAGSAPKGRKGLEMN